MKIYCKDCMFYQMRYFNPPYYFGSIRAKGCVNNSVEKHNINNDCKYIKPKFLKRKKYAKLL